MTSLRFNDKWRIGHWSFVMRRQPRSLAIVLERKTASGRGGLEALVQRAAHFGFERLAVFGSVARGDARDDSDVDLLVDAPPGAAIKELLALRGTFEQILGRPVDLVTYGGLKADDAKRLKQLEAENARLKKLLAEAELDKLMLREIAEGNF